MNLRAESFGEGGGEGARGEPFCARDCCLGDGAMGTGAPGLVPDHGVGREVGRWRHLSRRPLALLLSCPVPRFPHHPTALSCLLQPEEPVRQQSSAAVQPTSTQQLRSPPKPGLTSSCSLTLSDLSCSGGSPAGHLSTGFPPPFHFPAPRFTCS